MIKEEILDLKKKKGVSILAHNYQIPEIQDIADHMGDSLALSRRARDLDADIIIFCGVLFMAETAAILSPDKKIIIPDPKAGCPLADMVTPEALRKLKLKHPDAVVVTYVNSTAEVKAETDICCTSANALEVVNSIPKSREIIFGPDRNLGSWVSAQAERDLILWDGYCIVHQMFSADRIRELKKEYPESVVMVHPEVPPEIIKESDVVLGTGGMIRFAGDSDSDTFIVGTETGMVYRLKTIYPGKNFIPAFSGAVCRNMKKITPEKLLLSLKTLGPVVTVPEKIARGARNAIEKMMEIK
ncbi:MAG: quinolinate synthase NadA [Candidatus Krumholzibacteriota bacterium]|nr:quinolinate synthase NadA [Candidatus Krumholzibacteriota bacterium]